MIEVGNVGIGGVFAYKDALFVVLPFDWQENRYNNLCIAVRNPEEFDVGNEYYFEADTKVKEIEKKDLKTLLDI